MVSVFVHISYTILHVAKDGAHQKYYGLHGSLSKNKLQQAMDHIYCVRPKPVTAPVLQYTFTLSLPGGPRLGSVCTVQKVQSATLDSTVRYRQIPWRYLVATGKYGYWPRRWKRFVFTATRTWHVVHI